MGNIAHRSTLLAAVVLIVGGCSEDDDPSVDAGTDSSRDGGAGFDPAAPVPPETPALPSMTPCPDGWREVDEDGLTLCEPWPAAGRQVCGPGEAHFPGAEGCEPVGAPCPAGDWPEDLPTDRDVFYVRPGATGGTGSRDLPFGTTNDAVFRAAPGDVIALSKGDHRRVPISKDVEFIGACAAETRIINDPGDAWAVLVRDAHGVIRNMTIASPAHFGIVVIGAAASLDAYGVVVDGALGASVLIQEGAEASFERTRIVRPRADRDGRGTGFQFEDGAVVDIRSSVVEGAVDYGIRATANCTVTLENVATWGTTDASGWCLDTRASSTTSGRAFVCEDATGVGINVGFNLGDGPSSTTLEHVVIRRIADANRSGENGRGVSVDLDAVASLSKARVEDAGEVAIIVANSEPDLMPRASLWDVVIRDMRGRDDGNYGIGLFAANLGRVTVERLAVLRTRFDAIQVQDGGELLASDLTLVDTRPDELGNNGAAFLVVGGGAVVDRMAIRRSSLVGAHVQEGRLEARDVFVAEPADADCQGISATAAAELLLERGRVEGARGAGIIIQARSRATLADVAAVETQPSSAGLGGYGLAVYEAGPVELTRGSFERQVGFGVLFVNAGEGNVLRDVRVSETERVTCDGCELHGSGVAVFASDVSVDDFVVEASAICGVRVGNGGLLTLANGEVRGSEIGACVEDPGYDLGRLQTGVVYRDNRTNLDSTMLPVPEQDIAAPDFERR